MTSTDSGVTDLDLEIEEWEYTLVHETQADDAQPPWYIDYHGVRLRAHSKVALLHRLAEAIAVREGEHDPVRRDPPDDRDRRDPEPEVDEA